MVRTAPRPYVVQWAQRQGTSCQQIPFRDGPDGATARATQLLIDQASQRGRLGEGRRPVARELEEARFTRRAPPVAEQIVGCVDPTADTANPRGSVGSVGLPASGPVHRDGVIHGLTHRTTGSHIIFVM